MTIVVISPADESIIEFDWTNELPASVTVSSVVHTVPAPLAKMSEATVSPLSQVKTSGAVNGRRYEIGAVATLSNGEKVGATLIVRCFKRNA